MWTWLIYVIFSLLTPELDVWVCLSKDNSVLMEVIGQNSSYTMTIQKIVSLISQSPEFIGVLSSVGFFRLLNSDFQILKQKYLLCNWRSCTSNLLDALLHFDHIMSLWRCYGILMTIRLREIEDFKQNAD